MPLVTTVATTRLDASGRPWAFLTLGESRPGLLSGRTLTVHAKNGPPESPSTFSRRGPIAGTTDPAALSVVLNRAASVGEDLPALASALEGLHLLLLNRVDSATPPAIAPPSMPLNQRLSALLHRASGDSALAEMIDGLALGHPALRLARGTAWAGPLDVPTGSEVTLEIRETSSSSPGSTVLGRVTIRAGLPDPLPPPGPLAIVPDPASTGDLCVKLRWATSPELQRSASSGVAVWRVATPFAEARGWTASPPSAALLVAMAKTNSAEVRRIAGPVFPSRIYSAANVARFDPASGGDATTAFVTDDNGRSLPDGMSLPEGERVTYFAAALDPLGTPGLVSPGVPATFCRRIAPPSPAQFTVALDWAPGAAQRFVLRWRQNPGTNAGAGDTPTTRYELFRGDDLALHAQANRGTLDLDAFPIAPGTPDGIRRLGEITDPGGNNRSFLEFIDDTVPVNEANYGRTWWFAIRAVHDGPPGCGRTASPLSPPLFAALRQRAAPPAPTANQLTLATDCLRVACVKDAEPADTVSAEPLDPSVLHFRVRCHRPNAAIASAQFRVSIAATGEPLGPVTSVEFPAPNPEAPSDPATGAFVELAFTRPLSTAGTTLNVECRAVAFDGTSSRWAGSRAPGVATENHFVLHQFRAGAIAESERASRAADPLWASLGAPGPDDCNPDRALTSSPESGLILPVTITLDFPPRAAEWRLYRRVDDGPLTLVRQGLRDSAPTITARDESPPTTASTVAYYTQVLDENGYASPMALAGTRRIAGPRPPAPLLRTPTPADHTGTETNPAVLLSWFCPPQGVERFEVFVFTRAIPSPAAPPELSARKLTLSPEILPRVFTTGSRLDTLDTMVTRIERSFLTGRVGADFGPGPRFTLSLDVDRSREYTVWLRALGPGGEIGEFSHHVRFHWMPPRSPGAVHWPARPLPDVAGFHPDIAPVDFHTVPAQRRAWDWNAVPPRPSVFADETPVGIRVGAIDVGGGASYFFGQHGRPAFYPDAGTTARGRHDPNTQLFRHARDTSQGLLPCVLYRQQVTNAAFPAVSGDVIQCSPLLRRVAWSYPDQITAAAELVDPFFRWVRPGPNDFPKLLELFLVDTQPVLAGARYRYWITRFNETSGEPIQTVPCGEVTIEEAP